MSQISLASLSILLGIGYLIPQIYGLVKPDEFRNQLRKFPRSNTWGYLLVGLATIWFLRNVQQEDIADFASYKKIMLFGFGALGIATCIYVRDFLAVRGYAVLLLLLAKLMVDTARWVDSEWRLVIVVWAYLWVLGGMWFTISPWRVRDIILWKTANHSRIRLICGLRSAFGLLVICLGIFVF
ncbi:MAG: hypothetical protein M2R45_03275 [Verrucomicrobia subdivision 3 bacterium]|nr:hypothetical protein [Limisphaerales bacterium]MCS1416135.1 hypothetical protein [Limisphaerales bacterium]